MEQLIVAGHLDLLVEHALTEKDEGLIGLAVEALYPKPPPELLCHLFAVGKQPTPLRAVEFWLPRSNYLYAEDAIFRLYGPRTRKLAPGVIRALGRGCQKKFALHLATLLGGSMVNAKTAFEAEGVKVLTGGDYLGRRAVKEKADGSPAVIWEYEHLERNVTADSQRIVEAAVAIRHMGASIDVSEIDRLIHEVERRTDGPNQWISKLKWVRFDIAAVGNLETVLAGEFLPMHPDFGLSLLKQDLLSEIDALAAKFGSFSLYNSAFCYWPLLDYLECRGILKIEERWLGAKDYLRARKHGVPPPPWWQWTN
jgi:hypothetical protein